jgi:hypothetical protein
MAERTASWAVHEPSDDNALNDRLEGMSTFPDVNANITSPSEPVA